MDSKYIIGIPEMDKQHARIFELAERAKEPDLDESSIQYLILELINYANDHLDQEEIFLKDKGLQDFLAEHEKLHVKFREKAMEMYQELREAEELEAKKNLLLLMVEFIEDWIKTHIDVEDREYANLINKQT